MSFTLSANANLLFGLDDPVAAVTRASTLKLGAIEYWGLDVGDPAELRAACESTGVSISASTCIGVAANTQDSGPGLTDPSCYASALEDIERSVALATERNIDTLVVTVGPDRPETHPGTEHRAIVDVLRAGAPIAEAHDIDLVIEPLNRRVDHQGYYLNRSYEAYEIVEAVNSPAVSVLFDVYHQQITEGNIIQNLTNHLEYVGYVHIADVPGRHQPGTGELAYNRILGALATAGYDGYVGLEFAPTTDPAASIETVRELNY